MVSYGNIHFEIEFSENNSHIISLKDSECGRCMVVFKKKTQI